jgi:hypothetical protein
VSDAVDAAIEAGVFLHLQRLSFLVEAGELIAGTVEIGVLLLFLHPAFHIPGGHVDVIVVIGIPLLQAGLGGREIEESVGGTVAVAVRFLPAYFTICIVAFGFEGAVPIHVVSAGTRPPLFIESYDAFDSAVTVTVGFLFHGQVVAVALPDIGPAITVGILGGAG